MNARSPLRRVLCLGAAAALVALPISAPQVARASDLTLAQTIAADPELSTLARAIEAAGPGPRLGAATLKTALVNGKQRIEAARLAGRDQRTTNGYLIPIDRVLTP
jgi:hypothetical protein